MHLFILKSLSSISTISTSAPTKSISDGRISRKLTSVLMILLISSCATPKAMDIMQANDDMMSCNELRLAFEKASLSEDEAHANKGVTNENILLF